MDDTVPEPPKNFSWCEENVLAASGLPCKKEHLQHLVNNGIGCLVSLTEETEVSRYGIDESQLEIVRLPVKDFTSPTQEQVHSFLDLTRRVKDEGKAMCVHCRGGIGRAGTMVACYFVDHLGLSADEAIRTVRSLRPGSVESSDQEACIYRFAEDKKNEPHWQSKVVEKRDEV